VGGRRDAAGLSPGTFAAQGANAMLVRVTISTESYQ
jgi:hypothetical protein